MKSTFGKFVPSTARLKRCACLIFTTLAFIVGLANVQADDDSALQSLAKELSTQIKQAGLKKISVLDFTDLQGLPNSYSRFIAEMVTIDLVANRKDFKVVDRANLKRILDELKLSESGLVNPENAKRLGQVSGVDALIIGKVSELKNHFQVSAQVLVLETAEIAGAAKLKMASDDLKGLAESSVPQPSDPSTPPPAPKLAENEGFADGIKIQIDSIKKTRHTDVLVTYRFQNVTGAELNTALAVNSSKTLVSSKMVDKKGGVFENIQEYGVTGIAIAYYKRKPTLIKPNQVLTSTVIYHGNAEELTFPVDIHLDLLVGNDEEKLKTHTVFFRIKTPL